MNPLRRFNETMILDRECQGCWVKEPDRLIFKPLNVRYEETTFDYKRNADVIWDDLCQQADDIYTPYEATQRAKAK